MSARIQELLYGLVIVILTTVVGVGMALHGWRSHPLAFDMLAYFTGAENLLKTGIPASYGDISSYGSFSPPGMVWLLAPGMLVLQDPRLYEKLGGALLHLGTLMGVFLLARALLGARCAYLSVVVYGLSGLGLAFAGSLWPIGHPFFYVWMVYFAVQWGACQDARYLAAAAGTWAAGMYVDMALAPAGLVLPAIWLILRPPAFSKLHPVAALLTLAVWYPYLKFEVGRGFADLRSQLLLQNILPSNYREAWCNPGLLLSFVGGGSALAPADTKVPPSVYGIQLSLLGGVTARLSGAIDGLLANFREVMPFPWISVVLLLLTLTSLFVLTLAGFLRQNPTGISLMPRAVAQFRGKDKMKAQLFVVSLLVPWLVLLFVAEPGRPERFSWLWPLQTIAIAASVTVVFSRMAIPSHLIRSGQTALVALMLVAPFQSHLAPSLASGWAGTDSEETQAVDYVASQLRAKERQSAAIGYSVFVYQFMPSYNMIDQQYKVGADFDLWFKYRYSIDNTNRCAEGVSPVDEYRIVQARPVDGADQPRGFFDVPLHGFHLVQSFNTYQVFARDFGAPAISR